VSGMDRFKIGAQYVLPKHLLSRLTGKFAAAECGWLTHAAIKMFVRKYDVNLSEAELDNPKDFASFNDFFTRSLKEDARPLTAGKKQLAQPVDGTVSQLGKIDDDEIIQAKNHKYTVKALLGGDEELATRYHDGEFATIYLAPRDYHRIHMPLDGVLKKMIYVPGDLFSVNPLTAENVPGLFARNERVVAIFDSKEVGEFALVLVGATIVASIETVWAGTVTPPTGPKVHTWSYPAEGPGAVKLAKGEEMGRFKLGSTVVLVFPEGKVSFAEDLNPGSVTRMGEVLGKLK